MRTTKLTCKLYNPSPSIKLISETDGTLTKLRKPVCAAEIMMENPDMFVCDWCHLIVGSRVPGLCADERLEPEHIYFLLPMDMLYSVLTEEEMDSLSFKASMSFKKGSRKKIGKKKKTKTNIASILPALSDFCLFPHEAELIEDFADNNEDSGEIRIFRHNRMWRPTLDTIQEVC
ncbi:hypothetical protein LUZ60_009861 [Juncus effusus]|nr:hypothetical protein LUZ60_009861 [Juncus effusus]